MMRWLKYLGISLGALLIVAVVSVLVVQRVSDGPVEFLQGGSFKTEFVKVEDPELISALKAKLEDLAREFVAPQELGPPPAEPPNDIWFFRMDPRS